MADESAEHDRFLKAPVGREDHTGALNGLQARSTAPTTGVVFVRRCRGDAWGASATVRVVAL